MRVLRRAAAGLAATTALVVPAQGLLAGSASATTVTAAAPHAIGTITAGLAGVPRTLKRGSTIQLNLWYKQNSRDILAPDSFGLGIWNMANPGNGQLTGVSATFYDSVTRKWEKPRFADKNGFLTFEVPGQGWPIRVKPNTWTKVSMRLTLSSRARLGTWHLDGTVNSVGLFLPNSTRMDTNYLTESDRQYSFKLVR